MRDTGRQRHRQKEKQVPCREPDTGLNPRTPESRPGPKAGTKPLGPPGIPWNLLYTSECRFPAALPLPWSPWLFGSLLQTTGRGSESCPAEQVFRRPAT